MLGSNGLIQRTCGLMTNAGRPSSTTQAQPRRMWDRHIEAPASWKRSQRFSSHLISYHIISSHCAFLPPTLLVQSPPCPIRTSIARQRSLRQLASDSSCSQGRLQLSAFTTVQVNSTALLSPLGGIMAISPLCVRITLVGRSMGSRMVSAMLLWPRKQCRPMARSAEYLLSTIMVRPLDGCYCAGSLDIGTGTPRE